MLSTPAFQMARCGVELDHRLVLRDVDMRVDEGEVVALMGPNGSGKSTLVRALLGLVPVAAGEVKVYGVRPKRFRAWHRIGYVPQRLTAGGGVPATVREVVSSGRVARQRRLRRASADDRAAVAAALATVGLADRAGEAVSFLSGGQQQRVLIARALAGEPDAFVLDEPTAGVDAESQAALATTLRALVARGRTVLLVAHELGQLQRLVTRTVVLSGGHIAHDGPAAADEHAHVHPHVVPSSLPSPWEPA